MPINALVPYLQSAHLHERLYAKQALFQMDDKVRGGWEGSGTFYWGHLGLDRVRFPFDAWASRLMQGMGTAPMFFNSSCQLMQS